MTKVPYNLFDDGKHENKIFTKYLLNFKEDNEPE